MESYLVLFFSFLFIVPIAANVFLTLLYLTQDKPILLTLNKEYKSGLNWPILG